MDKDLLRALGYDNITLTKMEKWKSETEEYFNNDLENLNKMESYFQADYKKGIIVFRDTCPKNISEDLHQIFTKIFN